MIDRRAFLQRAVAFLASLPLVGTLVAPAMAAETHRDDAERGVDIEPGSGWYTVKMDIPRNQVVVTKIRDATFGWIPYIPYDELPLSLIDATGEDIIVLDAFTYTKMKMGII